MGKLTHLTMSLIVGLFSLGAVGQPSRAVLVPLTPQEQAVKATLLHLVRGEDQAILSGNRARLEAVFLPGKRQSALLHAEERRDFLKAWSHVRGLAVTSVTVSLRTPRITFVSPDRVKIGAIVSESYRYRYQGASTVDQFGLGIRHDYLLERARGRWYIASDYFTDPLDQDTRVPAAAAKPAEGIQRIPRHKPQLPLTSGAATAVSYADQYCGAAPGCREGFYNPAYNNFNGDGGDCTNFISQALKAGGFRETRDWTYDRQLAEGSRAWANARGFVDFLETSGRATVFARGRFPALTQVSSQYPRGAVAALRPGDLISYIERGRAVHSAIVVGYDSHGVPAVDSHTSDRYHAPWDLGWDYRTYYYLWHVHYPTRLSQTR